MGIIEFRGVNKFFGDFFVDEGRTVEIAPRALLESDPAPAAGAG
jgi:hypothetical protein